MARRDGGGDAGDEVKCVLAIDLGTSGPKAAVVTDAGRMIATARGRVETTYLPEERAEQDPEAVWSEVKRVAREALAASGAAPGEVLGILCSSQYASLIPVDAEGRALTNMILWLDRRGSARRLRELPGYPGGDNPLHLFEWFRRHGIPPIGSGDDDLSKMRWVKYAEPEIYARTHKFLEPADYLAMRFTGRACSNQCTSFMFLLTNNRRLDRTEYDPALVRYSGIDAAKLPELLPIDAVAGTVLPDVAAELGLDPATKVFTGMNDTQAGGMGTAAFAGDHAAVSIGSTSVMITHVDFKRTSVRHAILSIPSPVPGKYFVMAENGVAGGALEHFLEHLIFASDDFGNLQHENKFEALSRVVNEVPPGSGGVLFLPWMNGSLAPSADARMRGGFLNIGMTSRRSHLARAVLEGVAMNLRWLRGPVESFAQRRFTKFLYYGGGAESDAWAQILADVLAAPVHQLADPQYTTCLGGGLLALQRLGIIGYEDFERLIPVRKVYEPRAEAVKVYDELFPQFTAAFGRTQPILRKLNKK